MYVMDMHCHILPGVDDGAKHEEMSMEMIGIAYSQGIRKIMLTPHYETGKYTLTKKDYIPLFEKLSEQVQQTYSEMKLYLGNEIYYSEGTVEELKDERACTLADTRYVLVEFSPGASYQEIYRAIRTLVQSRYRPVIAHVERYRCLTKHMDRIAELAENGAYMQMNADSIVGSSFDGHIRWCRQLMTNGYISFIGTDAHNLDNRAPYVVPAVEWMEKKLDHQLVDRILYKNGERLLENKYL